MANGNHRTKAARCLGPLNSTSNSDPALGRTCSCAGTSAQCSRGLMWVVLPRAQACVVALAAPGWGVPYQLGSARYIKCLRLRISLRRPTSVDPRGRGRSALESQRPPLVRVRMSQTASCLSRASCACSLVLVDLDDWCLSLGGRFCRSVIGRAGGLSDSRMVSRTSDDALHGGADHRLGERRLHRAGPHSEGVGLVASLPAPSPPGTIRKLCKRQCRCEGIEHDRARRSRSGTGLDGRRTSVWR